MPMVAMTRRSAIHLADAGAAEAAVAALGPAELAALDAVIEGPDPDREPWSEALDLERRGHQLLTLAGLIAGGWLQRWTVAKVDMPPGAGAARPHPGIRPAGEPVQYRPGGQNGAERGQAEGGPGWIRPGPATMRPIMRKLFGWDYGCPMPVRDGPNVPSFIIL